VSRRPRSAQRQERSNQLPTTILLWLTIASQVNPPLAAVYHCTENLSLTAILRLTLMQTLNIAMSSVVVAFVALSGVNKHAVRHLYSYSLLMYW